MFQDIESIVTLTISLEQILTNALVAFICGVLIAVLYRFTYKGPSYTESFVASLILLTMITAMVIMVIGSNLARAFGLVGAMSIIRFRTAVKDTQDIMFIFFALAIGLAAGAGLHSVAITGTILIGIVAFGLSHTTFMKRHRKEYLLQFIMAATPDEQAAYLPVFRTYCKKSKLINMKTNGGEAVELSFYINLKQESDSAAFVRALQSVEGLQRINLFFDEEHY
jgi:uncharacterized membrane protein YhiD involved in acid resistance